VGEPSGEGAVGVSHVVGVASGEIVAVAVDTISQTEGKYSRCAGEGPTGGAVGVPGICVGVGVASGFITGCT
jgi:hypothetical protein